MNSTPSIQFPLPPESRFEDQTLLPADFVPSSTDVLCQRGRQAYNHPGNRRFRLTISLHLKRYQEAPNKPSKSVIVNQIVDLIREGRQGGFVRFDKESNRWCELGDVLAREKVGFTIREELRKKDTVYMDAKRSKRRESKRQRIAERNRSSMESITAAIKRADKSLLSNETDQFHVEAKNKVWSMEAFGKTISDDAEPKPKPLEVTSRGLEPLPLEIPRQSQVSHVVTRYTRLKSGDDHHPHEVLSAVQKPELRTAESRDWFTQYQMRRMSLMKEGEYSGLFCGERRDSLPLEAPSQQLGPLSLDVPCQELEPLPLEVPIQIHALRRYLGILNSNPVNEFPSATDRCGPAARR